MNFQDVTATESEYTYRVSARTAVRRVCFEVFADAGAQGLSSRANALPASAFGSAGALQIHGVSNHQESHVCRLVMTYDFATLSTILIIDRNTLFIAQYLRRGLWCRGPAFIAGPCALGSERSAVFAWIRKMSRAPLRTDTVSLLGIRER
jgi:hypothetical protein